MNKDTFVASIFGFGLGLVAAITLWIAPRTFLKDLFTPKPKTAIKQTVTTVGSVNGAQTFTLSVHDGDIVKNKTLKLDGQTTPNTIIMITTPANNQVTKTNEAGHFTDTLTLDEGANEIVVTSYAKDKSETQDMFVYYVADEL